MFVILLMFMFSITQLVLRMQLVADKGRLLVLPFGDIIFFILFVLWKEQDTFI